jgi:hypothetical protein
MTQEHLMDVNYRRKFYYMYINIYTYIYIYNGPSKFVAP